MKAEQIAISDDAGIDDAIRLMTEHKIKRLPVIDSQGIFRSVGTPSCAFAFIDAHA